MLAKLSDNNGSLFSENMNKMYGFEGEVKAKYSANMCDLFTEVYNWLPLCHLLNHRVNKVKTE